MELKTCLIRFPQCVFSTNNIFYLLACVWAVYVAKYFGTFDTLLHKNEVISIFRAITSQDPIYIHKISMTKTVEWSEQPEWLMAMTNTVVANQPDSGPDCPPTWLARPLIGPQHPDQELDWPGTNWWCGWPANCPWSLPPAGSAQWTPIGVGQLDPMYTNWIPAPSF